MTFWEVVLTIFCFRFVENLSETFGKYLVTRKRRKAEQR